MDLALSDIALSAISESRDHSMKIHKTRWFVRWTRKQGLNDSNLCDAVREMAEGLYEADLGGGLIKKRIARPGQGKRGSFRTLIATNKGNRWIFVYGFSKNDRSNIDKDEAEALKKLASELLSLTPEAIKKAKGAGELMEVNCDAED
jgi:hypothetical protein